MEAAAKADLVHAFESELLRPVGGGGIKAAGPSESSPLIERASETAGRDADAAGPAPDLPGRFGIVWRLPERDWMDYLKAHLVLQVVFAHFLFPYIAYGSRFAFVSIAMGYNFVMPMFVFTSGFCSGDLDKRRARSMVETIVWAYVVMQTGYGVLYTQAFCRQDDEGWLFKKLDKCPPVLGDGVEAWFWQTDPWRKDEWYFCRPFFHLWYLMCLIQWRVLRPIISAAEPAYGMFAAYVVALLAGFIDADDYLSVQRTLAYLPYFALGVYTKEHSWRLPSYPVGVLRKAALTGVFLALAAADALLWWNQDDLATVQKMSQVAYIENYSSPRDERAFSSDHPPAPVRLFGLRCVMLLNIAVLMFLFMMMVHRPGEFGVLLPADPTKSAAQERRQEGVAARVYLRMVKYGTRSLVAYTLHVAFVILAIKTGWYGLLDGSPADGPRMHLHMLGSTAMGYSLFFALSLKTPLTAGLGVALHANWLTAGVGVIGAHVADALAALADTVRV